MKGLEGRETDSMCAVDKFAIPSHLSQIIRYLQVNWIQSIFTNYLDFSDKSIEINAKVNMKRNSSENTLQLLHLQKAYTFRRGNHGFGQEIPTQ